MIKIKGWKDVTLKQFSDYNKISIDFRESIDGLSEDDFSEIIKKEAEFNLKICEIFSGLNSDELKNKTVSEVSEYVQSLSFLNEERKLNDIKEFTFKGKKYKIPDSLRFNTNYGQYIESMQSEFYARHTDRNSLIYLAHQLAHTVDNGEDWNDKYRDELAKEFENIPAEIALDFSFFLSKKLRIYSLAYLNHQAKVMEKKKPFTKRILKGLVGLKRYMNWRNVVFLINLTRLRLTVFYILKRQKFLDIFRTLRLNQITNTN